MKNNLRIPTDPSDFEIGELPDGLIIDDPLLIDWSESDTEEDMSDSYLDFDISDIDTCDFDPDASEKGSSNDSDAGSSTKASASNDVDDGPGGDGYDIEDIARSCVSNLDENEEEDELLIWSEGDTDEDASKEVGDSVSLEYDRTESNWDEFIIGMEDVARSSALDLNANENDEEDETVKATNAAIKKPRSTPPEINRDYFVIDNICFHPHKDIIALAPITGDMALYKYAKECNTLMRTIEVHAIVVCRDVESTEDDGLNTLTCSKDNTIMVTDRETAKLKTFHENAHDTSIHKLHAIDENMSATGGDGGTVKLWDLAKNEIFALKEMKDYVSQLHTYEAGKLFTNGHNHFTTFNIGARKLFIQSEPYEKPLTKGDSEVLLVCTTKGNLYTTFNWGQFGYHSYKVPGVKPPIFKMIANCFVCVAEEEGVIRSTPFRILGVVGQQSLDLNHSRSNDVRFWNVTHLQEFGDIK